MLRTYLKKTNKIQTKRVTDKTVLKTLQENICLPSPLPHTRTITARLCQGFMELPHKTRNNRNWIHAKKVPQIFLYYSKLPILLFELDSLPLQGIMTQELNWWQCRREAPHVVFRRIHFIPQTFVCILYELCKFLIYLLPE